MGRHLAGHVVAARKAVAGVCLLARGVVRVFSGCESSSVVPGRLLRAFALVVCLCIAPATARAEPPPHGIHSLEIPGGVAGALSAIGSSGRPERARFIVEIARRFYNNPLDVGQNEDPALSALVSRMSTFSRVREATALLDPRQEGIAVTVAREKAGNKQLEQWARVVGLDLKGGRKAPRLELSRKREAVALHQALSGAGVDMGALVRALNAGKRLPLLLPFDTVPLPLAPDVWTRLIFERQVTTDGLAAAILTSRRAALLYTALLSLDDETRAWLMDRPDLLARLYRDDVAAFVVAAPAVRLRGGQLVLPGGEAARAVWEALVGRSPADVERFVRALVERDAGQLAYFMSAMHLLSASQLTAALELKAPDAGTRVEAARQLYGVFRTAAATWEPKTRPFWRPAKDPALLLLQMNPTPVHPSGVPGSARFWRDVLRGDSLTPSERDAQRAASDVRLPSAGWILQEVFAGDPSERGARADQVLFAGRHAAVLESASVADAMTLLRAVRRLPALVLSLERAGIDDVGLIARLVQRADDVSAIDDLTRASIAQAQWQGSLAVLLSAAFDGGIPQGRLRELLSELAAIRPGSDGRFDGRLLAWTGTWVPAAQASAAKPHTRHMEHAWTRLLTGVDAHDRPAERVTWEGTTYVVDVPAAIEARLLKVRGAQGTPTIDLAFALALAAHRLTQPDVDLEAVQADTAILLALAPLLSTERAQDPVDREQRDQWRDAMNQLRRVTRPRDVRRAVDAGHALIRVADVLLARGLVELAYARVFADHETTPLHVDEAARRHEFGLRLDGDSRTWMPWTLPVASTTGPLWRVEGSLLALDVALAPSALRRISARPPAERPTLNDMDRRTFVETVVLMPRRALTDAGQHAIAAAISRGRDRAAKATDVPSRHAFAVDAGLAPLHETLWAWVVEHEPDRMSAWISPRELLLAGMGAEAIPQPWHAWGTATTAMTGCLCTSIAGRHPSETYAGHVGGSLVAVAMPDLQLRIAELLADLGMPAVLARDVMSAAALDLVNLARSQGHDDIRSIIDHVHGVGAELLETYLALFTVDGPLRDATSVSERRP